MVTAEERWREKYYDKITELNAAEAKLKIAEDALEKYAKIESWENSDEYSASYVGMNCGDYRYIKPDIGQAPIQVAGKAAAEALKRIRSNDV